MPAAPTASNDVAPDDTQARKRMTNFVVSVLPAPDSPEMRMAWSRGPASAPSAVRRIARYAAAATP